MGERLRDREKEEGRRERLRDREKEEGRRERLRDRKRKGEGKGMGGRREVIRDREQGRSSGKGGEKKIY